LSKKDPARSILFRICGEYALMREKTRRQIKRIMLKKPAEIQEFNQNHCYLRSP